MRFLFKTGYDQDIDLFRHGGDRFWYGLLLASLLVAPAVLGEFYLGELTRVMIWAVAGVGVMLLVGYTGLVSLGHAAFLAIGAYSHALLLSHGVPLPLALPAAALITAVLGALVAIPALRLTGVYLAIATLALAVLVEQGLVHGEALTGGFRGMAVPPARAFGVDLGAPGPFYCLCLFVLLGVILLARNLLRSPTGRAMIALRDSEVSARSLGVDPARTRAVAFGLSAGITGLAGGLFAHDLGYLAPDAFGILTSIQLLLMVVVGGLGSLHGAVFGALFVGALPQILALLRDRLPDAVARTPGLEPGLFGLLLVLTILFEPEGLYGRWRKIKRYFQLFPLYRKATFKRQRTYLKTERLR